MPLYELAFVDTIASSPTTRLDLNDMTNWTVLSGTKFEPPGVKRAVVSTLMYDGSQYPASAYEDRVLTLVLQITSTNADTAATQLQALARELDRETNFLRYKPSSTNPVFFRTKRSNLTEVVYDEDNKQATVQVLAEPFAYGLVTTALNAATVTNNPATVTRGMFFDLEDVKGDVETPLWLQFDTSTGNDVTVISSRRWGDVTLVPFVQQAEGMTALDADTTLQANSGVYSGAGQNFYRTTFATTPGIAGRLGITLPARFPGTQAESRGTYRLFARVSKTVSTTLIDIRFQYGSTNAIIGAWKSVPETTNKIWVDLGQLTVPVGADPIYDGYSGTMWDVQGDDFYIDARRNSGGGAIDWDVFLMFPADDQFAVIKEPAASGGDVVWDGPNEILYYDDSGVVASAEPIQHQGPDALMASPGDNRFFMGILFGPTTNSGLTQTTALTVRYWPRYIHVAPVST